MIPRKVCLISIFLILASLVRAQEAEQHHYTTLQYAVQLNYFGQNHLGSAGNMSQTSLGVNAAKLWTEKYTLGLFIGIHQRELLFPSTVNKDLASHALTQLSNNESNTNQDIAKALQHQDAFGGASRYLVGIQFYKALPYFPQIELYVGQSAVSVDLTPDHQNFIEFQGWEKMKHALAGATLKFFPLTKGIYSEDLPFFVGVNTEYGFPNSTRFNNEPIEDLIPDVNSHWTKAWRIGVFVGIGIL